VTTGAAASLTSPVSRTAPSRTRIKICGIRDVETALAAADAGADAIGLVRVSTSPRVVEIDTARRIAHAVPPFVTPVVVTADAGPDQLLAEWPHDWIQLHGAETAIDAIFGGRRIIRGLPLAVGEGELLRWDRDPLIAALLIDAPRPGSGEPLAIDDLIALRPRLRAPLIVAGGLTPSSVTAVIRALRPWAVDVSSGVESSRGVKDLGRIREFCAAVRAADS